MSQFLLIKAIITVKRRGHKQFYAIQAKQTVALLNTKRVLRNRVKALARESFAYHSFGLSSKVRILAPVYTSLYM